jgi:uncharacterized membrane protein YkvA (DUF1232 family)
MPAKRTKPAAKRTKPAAKALPKPRSAAVAARKRPATAAGARGVPLLRASDVRTIVEDLMATVAPGDVADLLDLEDMLRTRAAGLDTPELALLRVQLDFALDVLRDHLDGACPQIPYSTISLLTAGVCYFADEMDVIPDFLPGVGRLDDAVVMAVAFEMAADGIRRYCTWKDLPVEPLFGLPTRRGRAKRVK